MICVWFSIHASEWLKTTEFSLEVLEWLQHVPTQFLKRNICANASLPRILFLFDVGEARKWYNKRFMIFLSKNYNFMLLQKQ